MINPAARCTRLYSALPQLADPRLGAEAILAADDFFGPKGRMLAPEQDLS
jgi:allantoicase